MMSEVRILAVDDVPMNLEMLGVMLEDLDVELFKVFNGREALDLLETTPDVDAILLDLQMPVLDGFETLKILKKSDVYRDIPVIVITADKSEVVKTLALGANDFLAKPYNPDELRLRVMNHVRSKKLSDIAKDMNNFLEQEVIRKTAALREALAKSKAAEHEISLRLGMAAEFRDLETGLHTRRISSLSRALATLAGLSEEAAEVLRHASPLHDVGKIGIPDRILLKPGKLDHDEFEIMKMHTDIGGKILTDSEDYPLISAGRIIATQHHEKWDGSGYPGRFCGNDIHIYARIVTIVDVFDALTSERPYKEAYNLEKTLAIMKEGSGSCFDPQLFDLFVANIDQFVKIKDELRDDHAEDCLSEAVRGIAAGLGAVV
ncbi:MAG TPA: response regulator [Desulfuromonadales bacterium]|nr:response regulator [Desulfuromonadales bacterium]